MTQNCRCNVGKVRTMVHRPSSCCTCTRSHSEVKLIHSWSPSSYSTRWRSLRRWYRVTLPLYQQSCVQAIMQCGTVSSWRKKNKAKEMEGLES